MGGNVGQVHTRGRCPVCGRSVAARNGRTMYHYQHPRGPLNPRGMPCSGQGRPVVPNGGNAPVVTPAEELSTMPTTPTASRNPGGRPRDPSKAGAILDAAITVLAEHGIRALTMDAIAAAAHVGKATIYRRWETHDLMLAELVLELGIRDVPWNPTAGLREDLRTLVRVAVTGRGAAAERAVLSLLPHRPPLREAYIASPERRLNTAIAAARDRARHRADAWPPEVLIHACVRLLQHDALDSGTEPTPALIAARVDAVILDPIAAAEQRGMRSIADALAEIQTGAQVRDQITAALGEVGR